MAVEPQFFNEELSNYIKGSDNLCSIKALEWSVNVNKSIDGLEGSLKVSYDGCFEAIKKIIIDSTFRTREI